MDEAASALPAAATGRATAARPITAGDLRELRHEAGNALTPALAYAQFLLRRVPAWATDQDRRALQGIAEGIERTARLLERTAGASGGAPEACHDLAAIVGRALSQVPPERWADLRVQPVTDGPLLGSWDADRLTQVLVNLLSNAVKYSQDRTPIQVTVRRLGASDWARVVIQDHGIGIEPDALERVFAGHRTDRAREAAPGTGVGLPVSRRLAESEGGRLWAMNVPGGGSAFYLELPLGAPRTSDGPGVPYASVLDAARPLASAPAPNGRSQHPRTALVVEDDAWTRCALTDALEAASFTVSQASNGYTGVRLAAQIRPDVILLDLNLPERSGARVLEDLKDEPATRDLPVVVISGQTSLLKPCDTARASAVLQKPIHPADLLARIERIVQPRRRGA